jgi:radical SAM superfamily enzyme YgiQ (UPF0313 family)
MSSKESVSKSTLVGSTTMKYRRVMLTTARRPDPGTTCLHYGDLRPPLGLGYIAAMLEQHGVEVRIVDNYLAVRDMTEEIDNFSPDIIGMYMHTPGYYVALDLIDEIRTHTNVPLIVGGPHASLMPETIPDTVDHIVQGEGEYVMLDICKGAKFPRIIQNAVSGRIKTLDILPFPDYKHYWGQSYNWNFDMYGVDSYPVFTMHTSRSCPYKCTFCGVAAIWTRQYTQFSAESIVSEIDKLVEEYGCQGIYFREDMFTVNRKHLAKVCDLLIGRDYDIQWAAEARADITDHALIEKMYESGCRGLFLGLESGSDISLERKKKELDTETMKEFFEGAHKVGLPTYATFCMGTPGETDEEIEQAEEFIAEVQPTVVDRFAYLGLPKSEDYETLLRTGDYYHKDSGGIIYTDRHYELATKLYDPDDHRIFFLEQQRKYLEENRGKLTKKELAEHRFEPMDLTKHKIVSSTQNEFAAAFDLDRGTTVPRGGNDG